MAKRRRRDENPDDDAHFSDYFSDDDDGWFSPRGNSFSRNGWSDPDEEEWTFDLPFDPDEVETFHVELEAYETPQGADIITGPIHAQSKRGSFGATWWGKQWVAAIQDPNMQGRLDRGRAYARNGAVQRLEISAGIAFARVKGHMPKPYRTQVRLTTFSDQIWEKALDALRAEASYAAKLLAGEMPPDIDTVFQKLGASLFPRQKGDLKFACSCPDWGNPCKHAAAVYYLLAEQLDSDPFTLLRLRGRTRDQVLAALRSAAPAIGKQSAKAAKATGVVKPAEPVETPPDMAFDPAAFWRSRSDVRIMPPGMFVPSWMMTSPPPGKIEDVLGKIYEAVAEQALDDLKTAGNLELIENSTNAAANEDSASES